MDPSAYCSIKDCFSPPYKVGLCKAHLSEARAAKRKSARAPEAEPFLARVPELADHPFKRVRDLQKDPPPKPTEVYAITGGGMVKIGLSENIGGRFKSIQACSPLPLTLEGSIPGNITVERNLHRVLRKHRSHGEWFFIRDETIEVIERIKDRDTGAILEIIDNFKFPRYKNC